ncbi:MAG TPA: maltotransferase domain-containing protein [Acidimicrobiales bacterium]|nr:maltotransferase domain-containing protein [Acidimicrobiales bacterium]
MLGRIVIDGIRPSTPRRYPAKAILGEAVRVSADVFRDGHDILAARVHWGPTGNGKHATVPMHPQGNDRWDVVIEPTTLGPHEFCVEAWTDQYATWRHKATTKMGAGQEIAVELAEGALLAERRLAQAKSDERKLLQGVAKALRNEKLSLQERLAPALQHEVAELLSGPDLATDLTRSEQWPLWVDRERALVGAWYSLFPRSYGGLRGTAEHLPYVAAMGFDVLYLVPVHPVGTTFRKGPNNTLTSTADDVGSPWATGSEHGGHTAIEPSLGDFDDFAYLVERARGAGMEVALDIALQCSPDHPWVTEHPEWFHHRPDGSIAYAENPPKKYQDIYPINFWPAAEADRVALWEACKEIFDFWIARGVRIFRIDNPHTKPMAFWEWVIPAVQETHADIVFLSEAFTRPKVMAKLAEVGFSQSYTYFTWRTGKQELAAYLLEVSSGPKADYMRPNFWPNTPDILAGPLRNGPPSAFRLRLVLASTMVPSYGIYSGYELYENDPASVANEEYLFSEKYQLKHRDWDTTDSLVPLITRLNEIRRRHPALAQLGNVAVHPTHSPDLLVWSKHTDDRSDVVLVIVNLDPHAAHDDTLSLDLELLGLPWDEPYEAHDELSGATYTWQGPHPYVRLDPANGPAHVFSLRAAAPAAVGAASPAP